MFYSTVWPQPIWGIEVVLGHDRADSCENLVMSTGVADGVKR